MLEALLMQKQVSKCQSKDVQSITISVFSEFQCTSEIQSQNLRDRNGSVKQPYENEPSCAVQGLCTVWVTMVTTETLKGTKSGFEHFAKLCEFLMLDLQ